MVFDTVVPVKITNCPDYPFQDYPIQVGIPFPRGLWKEETSLVLTTQSGEPVLCDITPVWRWPDGSIRWAFLRFLASDRLYLVRRTATAFAGSQPGLRISEDESDLRVDTNAAVFVISRSFFHLKSQPSMLESDPYLLTDSNGRRYRFRIESAQLKHRGSLQASVLLKGVFVTDRSRIFCDGECRLDLWAGTGLLRIEFTLWNKRAAKHRGGLWDLGDPGSIFFRSLHLSFKLPEDEDGRDLLSIAPGGELHRSDNRPISIHQSSTGGPNWKSLAHVNKNNVPTPLFPGFRLQVGGAVTEGLKANPALICRRGQARIAFGIEDFWQRFPSRMEANGERVSVEPFPAKDEQDFELQPGEQATFRVWLDCRCGQDAEGSALLPARLPLIPALAPEWYCESGCFPNTVASGAEENLFFRNLVNSGVEGANSFFARRDRFEEYGWRNFGDIHADHERLHFKGSQEFVSHYNNQYDMIFGFVQQFVTTGDPRWHMLAKDLSRHVVDHDLYHTDRDKTAYNGGYFWHTAHYMHAGTATHRCFSRRAAGENRMPRSFGGGPSNEHNYSTGLFYYYLLTGDVRARRAVMQLARWVREMQDGSRTIYRFLSLNNTGYATCSAELSYQGPGRGAAYSINTCLDAFAASGNSEWLANAEELIRICIHPEDDPVALDLLNREARWSYVVFLQTVGKFLETKRELGQLDGTYHYAAACLGKFAKWMAAAEYAYLDRPEQLEYPTSTWAAQELRKTCVFLSAARYAREIGEKATFENKAQYFAEKSIEHLQTFDDRDSARNMALVLATVPAYFAFQKLGIVSVGLECREVEWGPRRVLVPQKIDAKRNLVRFLRTGGLGFGMQLLRLLRTKARDSKSEVQEKKLVLGK
jgi:hypothetical protein